jgi:pimeloyl-ACP methyl ester carboxylesterase
MSRPEALSKESVASTMMHTYNSHRLAQHVPHAQLRIYPDAGHGFLNECPELFAADVHAFLEK